MQILGSLPEGKVVVCSCARILDAYQLCGYLLKMSYLKNQNSILSRTITIDVVDLRPAAQSNSQISTQAVSEKLKALGGSAENGGLGAGQAAAARSELHLQVQLRAKRDDGIGD